MQAKREYSEIFKVLREKKKKTTNLEFLHPVNHP